MKRTVLFLMASAIALLHSCKKQDGKYYGDLLWQAYEAEDYAAMEEYAQKGAELGNPDAQYWLGWLAENGDDTTSADAIKWYSASAAHGNSAAMHRLGAIYLKGDIAHDYERARKWLEEAVANGDDDEDVLAALESLPQNGDYISLYKRALSLDERYPLGDSDPLDFPLAALYALKGGFADSDHIDVILDGFVWFVDVDYLGDNLETEQGKNAVLQFFADMVFDAIEQRERKNASHKKNESFTDYISVYETSANSGNAFAQYLVARLYENGVGVTASREKAEQFYDSAQEQGFLASENSSATTEETDDSWFCFEDGEEMDTLFVNSPDGLNVREAKNSSSRVLCTLPDKTAVRISWISDEKTTIDGITAPWVEIMNMEYLHSSTGALSGWVFGGYLTFPKEAAGISLKNENGTDFAEVEAAARTGNSLAQYKLGEYYTLGLGTKKDYKKALEYYTKAAEQDEPMAFRALACFYHLGLAVARDEEKAFKMLDEAHIHGACWWQDLSEKRSMEDVSAYHAPNQYTGYGLSAKECLLIGEAYENEPETYLEAMVYYMEAARHGDKHAMQKLAVMYDPDGELGRSGSSEQAKKWAERAGSIR